jgi:type I restriction enzyme M protein
VLFIDARKLGVMVDRRHRELTSDDVKRIADTYHSWRGELVDGQMIEYKDVSGFCRATKLDDVRKHGHILTPGRYVGTEEEEEDEGIFDEKMAKLTGTLQEQFDNSRGLDEVIRKKLRGLGYAS